MAKSTGKHIEISWWRRNPRPVRVEVHIKKPEVKTDGVDEGVHGWVPRKKPSTPQEEDRPRLYLEEGN